MRALWLLICLVLPLSPSPPIATDIASVLKMTDSFGSSAFGQTLQFITSLKLTELERQRGTFSQHVSKVLNNAISAEDDVSRVETLLEGIDSWSGLGGPNSSTVSLKNIKMWLHQAKNDPSIAAEQVQEWGDVLENNLKSAVDRFDYAKLFGNLLTEWLGSGDSQATGPVASEPDDADLKEAPKSPSSKTVRAEMLDQKARIQELIFEQRLTDTAAIENYLTTLFSGHEAELALASVRSAIGLFGKALKQAKIDASSDLEWLINSLLSRDILSAEKTTTLKSFLNNTVILEEVTSVLNMQMASLDSWDWPEGGVFIEMRRHLSGKYRAYMDTKIITALLFQYLGMKWSIALKDAFRSVVSSRAWKRDVHNFTRSERLRRTQCFQEADSEIGPRSIESERRNKQQSTFFMTQLPAASQSESSYNDEPRSGQSGNESVNVQQTLLKIVNTEIYLQKALHGQCTVTRADLEWFGPSLPHSSTLTVLRFFGMPDDWVAFFKKWLNASLRFDPDSPPRIRKRGVPIAHTLSVLCGETLLFGIDFAVNQRANGCYLYRIYDDFWWFHRDPEVCVAAWKEMQTYASLVGITFNMKKTGAVCVGGELHPSLPTGPAGCQWGFLRLDAEQGRFVIDQASVNIHIAELRRQLASTKSIFGFVNAYNKYLKFLQRNFGDPAQCFGRVHADEITDTFNRIQRELFPDTGGSVVKRLQAMIESRFGISDIPFGWFFFPISRGGLEVRNPIIDLLAVRDDLLEDPGATFTEKMKADMEDYINYKERWQAQAGSSEETFIPFEEYILGRETRILSWQSKYLSLQRMPNAADVTLSGRIQSEISEWYSLATYEMWNFALYADEVFKKFGTLTIVEPTLIPVGMVSVFRNAKVSWDS